MPEFWTLETITPYLTTLSNQANYNSIKRLIILKHFLLHYISSEGSLTDACPSVNQMTLKNFISVIFNLIGLVEYWPRNKEASLLFRLAGSAVPENIKQQSSESAAATTLTGTIEVDLCCVCLSRLNEKDNNTRILPCLHRFHKFCVDRWLNGRHKTCPLCRFSMALGAEERSQYQEEFTEEMVIWFSSFHIAGI